MSVEFLNTFFTTYSVFTTAEVVLDAIIKLYQEKKQNQLNNNMEQEEIQIDKSKSLSSPHLDVYTGNKIVFNRCYMFFVRSITS